MAKRTVHAPAQPAVLERWMPACVWRTGGAESIMNEYAMSRRSFVILALAVGLGVAAPGTSAADGGAGWETLRHDDGIIVQRKEMRGSPFVAFRGEGDVNAPLLLVGSVI